MKQREKYDKKAIGEFIKNNKLLIAVYVILRLIVIITMIRALMLGNYENAFVCVLVLLLFMIPGFLRRKHNINLPNALEIIILLFIFASEILGELQCYFLQFAHWDTLLHITSGFLCAAVGFSLIDILNNDSRIKFRLSPFYVALFSFCFAMTVGVIWEFIEFGADVILHTDMQKDTVIHTFYSTFLDTTKSNIPIAIKGITQTMINGETLGVNGYLDIGLFDTMEDLLVSFMGAVSFCVIGFFYIKHRGKGRLAKQFIPTIGDDNGAEKDNESNKGE